MGLFDIFKKKVYYFDKAMKPLCAYCQYGKRTKDGGRILCEEKGLMEENQSCKKFIYAPLKRIPTKQLKIEGALTEEEMYLELPPEILEALPEMPDEMQTPEVPDALKAPELPEELKNAEVMEILEETNPEKEPEQPSEVPEVPEQPDLPEVPDVPDLPEVPNVPDSTETPEVPDVPDTEQQSS